MRAYNLRPSVLHYERKNNEPQSLGQIIDAQEASGDSNSLAYIIHTMAEFHRQKGGCA